MINSHGPAPHPGLYRRRVLHLRGPWPAPPNLRGRTSSAPGRMPSTSRRRRCRCSSTAGSCRAGPTRSTTRCTRAAWCSTTARLRIAIVVVDSCMLPRDLLDRAKELAQQTTGIPAERMLISATHTHSAPAAMGALGCPADPEYVAFLPGRIAEGIERAAGTWPRRGSAGVSSTTSSTRTAGAGSAGRTGCSPTRSAGPRSGPTCTRATRTPTRSARPARSIPACRSCRCRSPDGRPIALLANYSMHYFGAPAVSADYYGRFAARIAELIGAEGVDPPFVGIMSQGTSGDQQWMDYGRPAADAHHRCLRRRGRPPCIRCLQGDRVPRLGPAGDGRDPADAPPARAGRDAPGVGPADRGGDGGPGAAQPGRGLCAGGALPPRRPGARAEAPGHPDRRPRHRGDPRRGLRADRPEDQGPEPVDAHVHHRAGQRLRGLHPSAGAARAGRLHHLAGAHGRAGSAGRAARSSRPSSACWSKSPASPGGPSRTPTAPTPGWCSMRSRWPTGA